MRIYFLLIFCVCFFVEIQAQPGCPQINAGQDDTLACGQSCTTLTATPVFSGQSNSYRIDQIPYNPLSYTGGTPIFTGTEDQWTNVINLPFTFCFFDVPYNQVVVGENGLITFDVIQAGTACNWDLTTVGPIPTTNTYTNTIMGPYQDLSPAIGGDMNYKIMGSHPCRMLVVSYDTPLFFSDISFSSCFGLKGKQQIVIYETTNIIEVYIEEKNSCGGILGWNDGLAILGIQNAAGTQAYFVPGRNNTAWTASNEGWRWTPDGAPSYTVNWYENGSLIGAGENINVCPSATSTYTSEAIYTPCIGGTPVTVTDDVIITVGGGMTTSIDSTSNISCFGANDGYAEASITGASPSVSYSWQPLGSTNLVQSNLAPGTYVFTADDAGCSTMDTVVITEPPLLTVTVPDTVISNCTGNTTGYLSSIPQGGIPPYTYEWSTNPIQVSQTATGLSAGNYSVTVTDSMGCTAVANGNLTVNIVGNLSLNLVTQQDLSCFQSNDGSLEVSVQNGTPSFSYEWNTNPVQNGAVASGLSAGTYTVSVVDGNGCSVIDSFTVNEPDELLVDIDSFSNVSCSGTNDGFALASVSGGTLSYNYSWNTTPIQNTANAVGLSAGTYTVTVSDLNGCLAIDSIEILAPDSLSITLISSQDASCFGLNDGSLEVSVQNGTSPYAYTWNTNPVQNSAFVSNLPAGTFTVTATDDSGCVVVESYIIDEPLELLLDIDSFNHASCAGLADGYAEALASGGTGSYNYVWNTVPVQNTAAVSGLLNGMYRVTVSDGNGCIAVDSVEITEPDSLVVSNTLLQDVSCFGLSDGSVGVSVSGGTLNYTYSWNTVPVQNSSTISSLVSGVYTVDITDANGCTVTDSYTVDEPTQLIVSVDSLSNISCPGLSDGFLRVIASGGASNYTYSWNTVPVQNTDELSSLSAGTYTVTVTDSNQCIVVDSFEIDEPVALQIDTLSLEDVSCFGASDGSIEVFVQNGQLPYTYVWNTIPVQNGAIVSGLQSGTYSVTATDNNGCQVVDSFIVNQPDQLILTIDSSSDVSCAGLADGYALSTVVGGTGSYNYTWSTTPTQNTAQAIGLSAGTYYLTVIDANACSTLDSIEIIEPDSLMVDIISSQDVSCFGESDGSATATASGGMPNYAYTWNTIPVQNTATAAGLESGFYEVSVTDDGNCVAVDTVSIRQPVQIIVSVDSIEEPTCFGNSDASAQVSVSGGNTPYSYEWSTNPSQTTNALSGVGAGTYEVTVTDGSQCITVTEVIIGNPSPLDITALIDSITCNGSSDGEITVSTSGGTPNYIYQWTPSILNGDSVDQLSAGNYSVIVTDANGCQDSLEIILSEPSELGVILIANDISCYGSGDGSIELQISGGSGPYTYQWTNGISQASNASDLVPGNYSVTVSDRNGCDTVLNADLTQPDPIFINLQDTFEIEYGNSVMLDNSIEGGVGTLDYNWDPSTWLDCFDCQIPESTPDYTTIYEFTVTDENTCMASASTTVLVNIDQTIYIPNAFSPNGDGINDVLQLYVGDVSFFSFKVFTYWGERIFATNDVNEKWDGTYKGKPVNPDVYVYHLEIGYPDLTETFRKGSVTVIR